MFDKDKWQEIFDTIRKHKLRTFLTALGVFWGIFMLIVLMGAGTGLQNGVLSMFGGHATNAMYVWPSRTTMAHAGFQPGRRVRITNSDVKALKNEFGEAIEYLAPRLWVNAGEISRGDRRASFEVRGDGPDLVHIDAINLKEGRFLNPFDLEQKRKVAVIGNAVRTILFPDENPLGAYIRINGTEYLVVGIFQSNRSEEDRALQDEKTILIPHSTAQIIRNRPQDAGWFVCTIKSNYDIYEYENKILAFLKKRHKIHPDDRQGIRSENVAEEVEEIMGLFTGIKLLVWFVGIGSLLAGIVGVGNIMLIIVKERTKEIGIRKAMGATPRSIISMILMESVFITTFAGYFGLIAGIGVIYALKVAIGDGGAGFFANPQININVGIAALLILVIFGALAGLIPAMTAARINPVEALRDE